MGEWESKSPSIVRNFLLTMTIRDHMLNKQVEMSGVWSLTVVDGLWLQCFSNLSTTGKDARSFGTGYLEREISSFRKLEFET